MGHINGISNRRNIRSHRRLRPGMHERRFLNRKEALSFEVADGISVARDTSIALPFESAKPSPLRRQTFDQSWQRWKAREAEVEAEKEIERRAVESEQCRLFGGDVGDDELRYLGILYSNDSESSNVPENTVPEYSIRYVRPRRRRNATTIQLSLPRFLASSLLSDNSDIARFMTRHVFESDLPLSTIQHRDTVQTPPLSLPPPLSRSNTVSDSSDYSRQASPMIFPSRPISFADDFDSTWDILNNTNTNSPTEPATPASEPETWILLSDDS